MIIKKLYRGVNTRGTRVTTLFYSDVKKQTESEEQFPEIPANALQDCNGTYIQDMLGAYIALEPLI